MRLIKHKKFSKVPFLIGLVLGLAFICFSPAAYGAANARCALDTQDALVFDCSSKTDNYPSASGNFEAGHCYLLKNSGFGLVYFDSSCEQVPFVGSGSSAATTFSTGDKQPSGDVCGSGDSEVHTSINIGCRGQGNSIVDALFAIIRFLSVGVGIVVVGSIVLAGVQYSAAHGDPSAVASALNRVRNTVIALLIYIFAAAILNYLIPGMIFK